MTSVFITIDTEYSSGLVTDLSDEDRRDNFARSIACATPDGPAGVSHKLKLFEEHGINAVFFVDPMPALVWGIAAIEDVVGPIIDAGQDVQLHCHTEWLALAGEANPLVSKRTGDNLFDFPLEEQQEILTYARDTLIAAGAPEPVAFRAGNYGANDNTLRALASLGLQYDSSHCPALGGASSRLTLGPEDRDPLAHAGMIEVPVGTIGAFRGKQRHAQITALSLAEMCAAIHHAQREERQTFTLVSHSFELINRRTQSVNRVVRKRFDGLCRFLSRLDGVTTGNYRDSPPRVIASAASDPLPACPIRVGHRLTEQLISNMRYGAL